MKIQLSMLSTLIILLSCVSCDTSKNTKQNKDEVHPASVESYYQNKEGFSTAVFASGCFWCVEAIFESVDGVDEVISGYTGGSSNDATYDLVSAGRTDHAEAVIVYYDSTKVQYPTLLEVFFGSHDPTTLNRQGNDIGRQYRSAIFYMNDEEQHLAKAYIQDLVKQNIYGGAITTVVEKLDRFYPAEEYHQNYERRNPNNPYVRSVSIPRLKRFQKKYPHLLKKNH